MPRINPHAPYSLGPAPAGHWLRAVPLVNPPAGDVPEEAAVVAAGWPVQVGANDVLSSFNYACFQHWARDCSKDELRRVMQTIFTIEHNDPFVAYEQPTIIRGIQLPRRYCEQPQCPRCMDLRGGYQFRWLDPRWTGTNCLVLGQTPEEAKTRIMREGTGILLPIPSISEWEHFLAPTTTTAGSPGTNS